MFKSFLKNKKYILLLLIPLFFGACSVFRPVKNQGEPRFIDYSFIDKDGNKIEESVSPSQKFIYLVIITENAIGEKVTIKMDEKTEADYIYKGKYFSEKLRFKIHKSKEKLKLYIYNHKNKRHRRLKKKAIKSKN